MARDPALSSVGLQTFLSEHPEWSVTQGGELERTFTFARFLGGIAFVQAVAAVAAVHDHHPDLDIRYTRVTVRLFTHDSKALTARDLQLAAECDRLAKKD
ncbi:MAG: putative pterin-4-alpha-carbinolamine dehydratase [Myxococcaceae bacterium]|nr:putative pterin-4-alpha-carbinolamine dehydratase [Myxococcaceae bacterium]